MPYADRLNRLYAVMDDHGLDVLILNPGPTLPYMTNLHFHISERPVVACFVPDSTPTLVCPQLELLKVEHAPFALDTYSYSESLESWQTAFTAALEHVPAGSRVGIEDRCLRVLELRFLERAMPQATFVSAEPVVASLRMQKDALEVETMTRAVKIAEQALADTLPHVRPGVTEREINARLIQAMLQHGSGGELPFQPIIAFGANSANPHAVPTDYAAQEGDLILFDWGANVDGYFSDLTRTFALGEPSEELRNVYETVRKANEAGRAAGGPGIPAGDVDKATRSVIETAGYGRFFVHRTGHGLGLEVHEDPYIRSDNQQPLAEGMTYTVEPGIYLAGKGGVRIEDDMLVTPDGCRSLSTWPRELTILPT
ncbi:MAG: aminopeptidase P family protein [Rhodothermales bacterium]